MTGLEKIIEEIEKSAGAEANEILVSAEAEAEALQKAAIADAERRCSELLAQAKRKAEQMKQRAESAANLQKRQAQLSLRQQLIAETLDQAALALEKLPDAAYRDFWGTIAAKTGLSGSGAIWVNATDEKRLGQEFLKQFPSSFSASYAPENANIKGGFIVISGNVKVDCSIGAIFASLHSELADLANKSLFEQV